MVFWLVVDPLTFASVVILAPPVLFSILVFVSHSNFWIFQHPGLEVPDTGWIYLSGIPVGGVVFLRQFLGVIC